MRELQTILTRAELDRAERFHFARDGARFVVAHGLLRVILSRYLDSRPESIWFRYGPNGKPALAANSDGDDIRFNLAHCDNLAVVAISQGGELGVDIERIRPELPVAEIAEHYFSAWEAAALQALPATERCDSFFRCWTGKEAYVKATGKGLSMPLDQFDVSLLPGEPAALLLHRGDATEPARWSLQDLPLSPGFVAALGSGRARSAHSVGRTIKVGWRSKARDKPAAGSSQGDGLGRDGSAMNFTWATIWHGRARFLPGIIAVAFSALLIFVQSGLLVGMFSLTSTPIDHAAADVWIGHPMNMSVDLGRPIPERWLARRRR